MNDDDETIVYFLSACLLGAYIMTSSFAKADNEIFIDQSGNNFAIGVNWDQISPAHPGWGPPFLCTECFPLGDPNPVVIDLAGVCGR